MGVSFFNQITTGIPSEIPDPKPLDTSVPHAPVRPQILTVEEKKLALHNALRYFPESWHEVLASEFLQELDELLHLGVLLELLLLSALDDLQPFLLQLDHVRALQGVQNPVHGRRGLA